MSSRAEFLLARIAEDEALAELRDVQQFGPDQRRLVPDATHDALSPVRVLAECEAKRRIVAAWLAEDAFDRDPKNYRLATLGQVLQLLAQVYSDHADFAASWVPGEPTE